jgi:hypothetical protein
MTRGARAERQAKLRLLEAVRVETDAARKQLTEKCAAAPALEAAQAEKVWAEIRAMSHDNILEFFRDYPLRRAGGCVSNDRRSALHQDDPELATAVDALNLALSAYDKARLDLRVIEFLGGQLPASYNSTVFHLDVLGIWISFTKSESFNKSLHGGDIDTAERELFEYFWAVHVTKAAEQN